MANSEQLVLGPAESVKRDLSKIPGNPQGVQINLMKSKFTCFLLATVFALSVAVLAQAGKPDAALPAAPSASTPPATAAAEPPTATGGNRVGTINIEQAIYASNEGQRDFEALGKKLEPKQIELKNLNDEVESLKKQLSTAGDKLSEDARGNLVKQIEQKQKSLERSVQDARDDAGAQQNEIAQRILQKMAPVIVSYAQTAGFGMIVDTSNPWPQGPILWALPSMDITRAVVDAYNVKSGVPAPAKPAGAMPKSGAGVGAKPAAPAQPKPQTTTPPPK
jgi:outer membrane protein